jgi:hypothetical protein
MSLMMWTRTAEPYSGSVTRVTAAAPPQLVDVTPTHEIRTVSPVNEVAVDGGRAATLVGAANAWEYLLVWSPKGVVVRATLSCDTQESNAVLAGNRFAHVCFQDANYVVTGTVRPLRGRLALRAAGTTQVALAGGGSLVAGSVGRTVVRFDARRNVKVRTYRTPAIVEAVDGNRLLVDRDAKTLDVLTSSGALVATIRRAHEGGVAMGDGRVGTIGGRTLVVSDVHGNALLTRTVAAGAHLEDLTGALAVYSVETRLHLLRLSDGRDVALRLRRQFGYAHARTAGGALFYTYNERTGKLGHAGYLDAAAVRRLFGP